jgi:hypothetical protein
LEFEGCRTEVEARAVGTEVGEEVEVADLDVAKSAAAFGPDAGGDQSRRGLAGVGKRAPPLRPATLGEEAPQTGHGKTPDPAPLLRPH